jgi:YegS/Rv2252/BmrU family lipid kinase
MAGPHDSTASARGVLIVGNPYSGARHNRRRVEALVQALREEGLAPEVVWQRTERTARLRRLREEKGCRCVVAAGGDGTVADIINEFPPAPLAVLPLGTENVFARAFGFSQDTRRLARAIAAGRSRAIDLGRAGNRFFGFMLGAGFDAAIVHRLARWRASGHSLKRVTYRSYLTPIRETMRAYPYGGIVLEADGVSVHGAHAFIFNIPQYAMGLSLAPDAKPDDGRLNWVVLQRPGLRNLLNYAWAVARGRHLRRRDVKWGAAARIRITAQHPVPLQADGEAAGWTPVEVEAAPAALRVIVFTTVAAMS